MYPTNLLAGLALAAGSLIALTGLTLAPPAGAQGLQAVESSPLELFKLRRERDPATPTTHTFEAFGQRFDLVLERNRRLTGDLGERRRKRLDERGVRLLRGRIEGVPGSWVRLSRSGGKLSGALHDGFDLYVVEDDLSALEHSVEDERVLRRAERRGLSVVYRMADMEFEAAMCAHPEHDHRGVDLLASYANATSSFPQSSVLPATGSPDLSIDVAVVTDRTFVDRNNDPEAAALARMNVADGIFSEQVGVRLNVTEVRTLNSNSVVPSTGASAMLNEFSSYMRSSAIRHPGLAHLFTGRDLSGSTVGIAWVDALCSTRYGNAVSQLRGTGTAGALIVAHELGHNFGAPHDGQSGACRSVGRGFIMWPSVNNSDQFSNCSIDIMRARAEAARCVSDFDPGPAPVPVADVRINDASSVADTVVGSGFDVSFELRNAGSGAAVAPRVDIEAGAGARITRVRGSGGCEVRSNVLAVCTPSSLDAGRSVELVAELEAVTAGDSEVTLRASAGNDENAANNLVRVPYTVVPLPPADPRVIYRSGFDDGPDGFGYSDRALGGPTSLYASGGHVPLSRVSQSTRGSLRLTLGGRDDESVADITNGWTYRFELGEPGRVQLGLSYFLLHAPNFERDEFVEALVRIDGRPVGPNDGSLATLSGDGNGGRWSSTNAGAFTPVQIDLGVLPSGPHTLVLGGRLNKKTFRDERSNIYFDDVEPSVQ